MHNILEKQRKFFNEHHTQNIQFRKEVLNNIKKTIFAQEIIIIDALKKDLCKPTFESFTTEIYLVLKEIKFMLQNIDSLSKTKFASFTLPFFSKTYIKQHPYGVVLILAPWNYPFQLCMLPLIGALAAGNCVIIKPSEYAPHTAQCIQDLISLTCLPEHVAVIQGNSDIAEKLLQEHYDYIFFTGSTRVGKRVMHAAAEHLTPLTLELGGKNPCIVDDTANIATAMRRIAWGKFLNAGQSCVAPDYLLVHESIKDTCITFLKKSIQEMYGNNPITSNNYSCIINTKHMNRLKKLLENTSILYGGEFDDEQRYIAPTLIDTIALDHPIMQEEIFGPLLPIITYKTNSEAINYVDHQPNPLASYIFSTNRDQHCYYTKNIKSGGICINDVVLQTACIHLPFGGVGNSGFGAYHGKYSFQTFSRPQGYLIAPIKFDFSFRYPPYTKIHSFIQKILRLFVA